jgi:hypothetical protein
MMKKTHRAYAGAFWMGSSLLVDGLAVRSGHSVPISPPVVAVGLFVAPLFSSGKLSPDVDHTWAPGPPRNHYDWRYHRGFTHRVWFAAVLTLVSGLAPFLALLHAGLPVALATVAFVPVTGWWSHLSGDMIFGRILILGKAHGLGWTTGGAAEEGGSLLRDPAAKVSVAATAALVAAHLALFVSAVS